MALVVLNILKTATLHMFEAELTWRRFTSMAETLPVAATTQCVLFGCALQVLAISYLVKAFK